MDPRYVTIPACRCLDEISSALLCVVQCRKFWIPTSVIRPDSQIRQTADEGSLEVERWFARKAGLLLHNEESA